MTVKEAWSILTDFNSPPLYKDFGLYFTVGATLQRRVWFGLQDAKSGWPDDTSTIFFPNQYIFFIGSPGTGKGRVMTIVRSLLDRMRKVPKDSDPVKVPLYQLMRYDPIVSIAPQHTNFADITQNFAKARQSIQFTHKGRVGNYLSEPYCVLAEELAMFLANVQYDPTIIEALTTWWDGKRFDKSTKTAGQDDLRLPCLTILACSTPEALARIFTATMASGMTGRSIFLYAETPKKQKGLSLRQALNAPEAESNRRTQAWEVLVAHFHKLTKLYGPVAFSDEALDYLDDYSVNREYDTLRLNKSTTLNDYYTRKLSHVIKLVMCIHFTETDSLKTIVELSTVKKALELLEEAEKNMHLAAKFHLGNPDYQVLQEILAYIEATANVTDSKLTLEFLTRYSDERIRRVVALMMRQNLIEQKRNKTTGKVHYHVKATAEEKQAALAEYRTLLNATSD